MGRLIVNGCPSFEESVVRDNERGSQARHILAEVERLTGVTIEELMVHDRRDHIFAARATAMRLLRDMARMSYPEIGAMLGRDHSAVINACRSVERPGAAMRVYIMVRGQVALTGPRIVQGPWHDGSSCVA